MQPRLRKEIERLAEESQRPLSDYVRYILEHHVAAAREEEEVLVEEDVMDMPQEVEVTAEAVLSSDEKLDLPRCYGCRKVFTDCDC